MLALVLALALLGGNLLPQLVGVALLLQEPLLRLDLRSAVEKRRRRNLGGAGGGGGVDQRHTPPSRSTATAVLFSEAHLDFVDPPAIWRAPQLSHIIASGCVHPVQIITA